MKVNTNNLVKVSRERRVSVSRGQIQLGVWVADGGSRCVAFSDRVPLLLPMPFGFPGLLATAATVAARQDARSDKLLDVLAVRCTSGREGAFAGHRRCPLRRSGVAPQSGQK